MEETAGSKYTITYRYYDEEITFTTGKLTAAKLDKLINDIYAQGECSELSSIKELVE